MTGYKTILFNALLAAWGVLEATDWASVVGSKSGYVLIAIAAIGGLLRMWTKTPAFSKT
jgi:hypothetical protein